MKTKIFLIFSLVSFFSINSIIAQGDDCATAQNLGTLPAAAACPGAGAGAPVNVAGTLVGATPANPYLYQPGCSGAGGPNMGVPANDVWYTFTASGYQCVISITGATFANPNVAFYSGTCGALGGGVGGCAVGTGGTVTLTVEQMVPGTQYYVQVSGNTGQTGTFNMSIRNNRDCTDCLNSSTLTVNPLPVNGMYQPGQTVNFCYHISQYTQVNTNWLHGVQLNFGSGWNLASLTTAPPPSCAGTGNWAYYPGGCTGTATGVPFGPGFYYNYTTPADANPGNNFGDNCQGAIAAGTWNFCFSITTAAACNPGSNLSVTINTSGDGETGSWNNAGCLDDPATVFNAVGSCCPPTMSSTAATCVGNNGTATATPTGAGAVTYSWTPGGQTTQTATGLAPGTYTVSLNYTAINCTVTNTVTVGGGGSIPVPTAGSNSPVCVGGTLNLTAANTVGGATYSWAGPNSFSSALQNPSIVGVTAAAAGTYTVTATSAGCSNTSTVTVTINPQPTVTVPANSTVCAGANVPATNFTSTPVGATYTWTNSNTAIGLAASGVGNVPAFTATNAGAAAITATITVTPTLAGCTGPTNSYTITVNPTPTVTVPANITVCNGGNVSATNFTSTPAGGTFAWTNSNTAIGLAASGVGNVPAFTATNAGAAAITATITVTPTVAGCPGTPNTYTITVNPTPTVTVPANITVCTGNNVAATNFTSTPAGGTFAWTNSNTTIGLGASGVGNVPTFTAANGTGSAITGTITVTPTVAGCVGTPNTYTITVNANLPVNAGVDDTICYGGNIVLNASPVAGGNTYLWSPSTGLSATNIPNPTASPTSTTNYTITITDALGCTGNDNVTVYVDAQLTTAIAGINVTCNGANNGQVIVIPAGGTSPYTYLWNTGCVTPSCNGLAPGSYTVTVTDAWGCTIVDDTVVTQPTLLTISTTGTTATTCNGACDGTATAAANGGTTTYSYSWNTIPVQNTATATGLCAGTYTCTVTDANGCTATTTATITQPTPVVIAPIANVTICNGGNTVLTASASGGTAGYTYSWSPATGLSATNVANPTASPASTTTYTVTATDANGCAAPGVTVTVTVNPLLSVIANGTASICPGASTAISAVASNGNGGPYTYSWSPAAGLSNANIANPTASPAGTTTYTVTATDGCSPAVTATVTVTVLPNPTVVFAADVLSGCAPLCVNFTDASNVAGGTISTWNWSFGGDGTSTLQNPTHCFANAGSYSITLTVVDNSGCTSTFTNNNMINVWANPIAEFVSNPNPATVLDLNVMFTNQSSSDVTSWIWDFGDGGSSNISDPTHTFPPIENSVYNTMLVVQNANGCVDTVIHPVIVSPEFTFFIPNAFSPNGDGVNDFFIGKGVGIKTFEMFIFDRWGNLIYYTDSLLKPWDGKANHGSDVAQQDVYVWKVALKDVFDRKHSYIGSVTLVK